MKKLLLAATLLVAAFSSQALAQSSPGLTYGQVPTAGQWNSYFAAKQDVLGFVPLSTGGGVMLGRLVTATVPLVSGGAMAGLTLPHGSTPVTPQDGDMWTTTSGLYVYINGGTVGPLVSSASVGLTVGSTPIASGTTTRVLYDNAGVLGEYTISGTGSVAMTTSPTFVTPTLGVAGGTSLALNGASIGSHALAATGTANISGATTLGGALTYGGVTLANSVTGTGSMVLSTSPTLTTPVLGVASGTSLALGGAVIGSNAFAVTGTSNLGGATTVGAALTYGGVTLANSVTGTGSMVLSTSPTIASPTFSGTVAGAGTVPLSILQAQAAYTLVGNTTSGVASPTAFAIGSITNKPSPTSSDILLLQDASTGALRNCTIAQCIAGVSAGVTALNGLSGSVALYNPPQGRLTLTSATPVLTATTTAQGTVYYTPYAGNMVPIYDGTNVVPTAFAEVSQALSDTTKSPAAAANNSNYDFFCWIDTGPTNRCTRGPAWTNDTTRSAGTALVRVNGLLLNDQAITNGPAAQRGTYVGTIHTNGTATVDYQFGAVSAGWTPGIFGVWNMYNRVRVTTFTGDSTDSWTYNVANTWRAPNGNATARVSAVRGLNEDGITATYAAQGIPGAATISAAGIGLNSTTAFSGQTAFNNTPTVNHPMPANFAGLMGLGYAFVSAIEYNTTTTASTWSGDSGTAYIQTGMTVTLTQ